MLVLKWPSLFFAVTDVIFFIQVFLRAVDVAVVVTIVIAFAAVVTVGNPT